MKKTKVYIADGLAGEGIAELNRVPEIEVWDAKTLGSEEAKTKLAEADILIVRSATEVNGNLLEGARSLKLVIRAGIGLDNVDIPAATDRGIVVMNAPTGNIVTTAEHTVAMMFAATRHIPAADASMRKGKWEKKSFQGNELFGKTIGVLGLGNIGKTVARIAHGIGMQVIAFDPVISREAAAKYNARLVEFNELLKSSDYITVHVPLNKMTKHLIGAEQFKMMKKRAYLINCARGGIVDENALAEALKNKVIQGAAVDVFEQEPIPPTHPFLSLDNAVLTPHLGASTDEAQTQVALEVAEQITQYVQNGVLKNAINVPNMSLEQLELMRPFVNLAEKLGSFAAQVAVDKIEQISIHYFGEICDQDTEVLTLSVLKGFLTPLLNNTVNFVNAKKLMKERGIRVQESFEQECLDYSNLIQIKLETSAGKTTCSGTIFGRSEPRIVRVDGFQIEAVPKGFLLFTRNTDQPGVIGDMGTILGKEGVNISRMALGFDRAKGQAIALINVDSNVEETALNRLRQANGMLSVCQVQL